MSGHLLTPLIHTVPPPPHRDADVTGGWPSSDGACHLRTTRGQRPDIHHGQGQGQWGHTRGECKVTSYRDDVKSIYKFKKVTWLFLFVCVFGCQLLASCSSFGQLLRCAHKCIVNIMKVYIEKNNMQVELIQFRTKILPLFTFTFAKRGIQRDPRVYTWKVVPACSISSNSTIICYSSLRFWLSRSTCDREWTHV